MRKLFSLGAAALVVSGCLGFGSPKNPPVIPSPAPGSGGAPSEVRLQAADGPCNQAADCQELQYGCGKLICASTPEAFANLITDCMVQSTPKDDGFFCACVTGQARCGWVK